MPMRFTTAPYINECAVLGGRHIRRPRPAHAESTKRSHLPEWQSIARVRTSQNRANEPNEAAPKRRIRANEPNEAAPKRRIRANEATMGPSEYTSARDNRQR